MDPAGFAAYEHAVCCCGRRTGRNIGSRFPSCIIHNLFLRLYQYLDHTWTHDGFLKKASRCQTERLMLSIDYVLQRLPLRNVRF